MEECPSGRAEQSETTLEQSNDDPQGERQRVTSTLGK